MTLDSKIPQRKSKKERMKKIRLQKQGWDLTYKPKIRYPAGTH